MLVYHVYVSRVYTHWTWDGSLSSQGTTDSENLTLNPLIATKVVCFSCLLKCLRSLYGKQCGPSVDPEQTAPIGAVCSGSALFASILNL